MSISRNIFFFSLSLSFSVFVVPAEIPLSPKPNKMIALTFDDGPRPASTHRLQTMLGQHGVVGTFFVVGHMANRYPQVVRSLAGQGHEIANHSWHHGKLVHMPPQKVRKELDATRELIHALTGVETWLFRVPGSTKEFLQKRFQVPSNYHMVMWDVHSLDHEGLSAREISDRILSQVTDGSVILLHNGLRSTVEAIDCFVPELKARGFEFVTVSSLLRQRSSLLTSTQLTRKRHR